MVNDNRSALPPPPQMQNRQTKSDNGGFLKIAGIALLTAIVVIIGYGILIGGIAPKKYVDTTFVTTQALQKWQTDLNAAKSSLDSAITSLPTTISNLVDKSLSSLNNDINTAKQNINDIQNKINELSSQLQAVNGNYQALNSSVEQINGSLSTLKTTVTGLIDSLASIQKQLSDYDTRIKAIETKLTTPTTPSANNAIPGVSISVKVTDEGTLQSNNSTVAELKLTLTNNGNNGISDIRLRIMINFDNYALSQAIQSYSYGSWVIDGVAYPDGMMIRGNVGTLDAGRTRNIYISIRSYAVNYALGGITYVSVSNNDIEVIDWNYAN